jgi:myosin-6
MDKLLKSTAMLPSRIYSPSPTHGFIPGTITDLGPSSLTVTLTDPTTKKEHTTEVSYNSVFPAEDGDKDHDDNCGLMYLNEATLLENLKRRWGKGVVYVSLEIFLNYF